MEGKRNQKKPMPVCGCVRIVTGGTSIAEMSREAQTDSAGHYSTGQ